MDRAPRRCRDRGRPHARGNGDAESREHVDTVAPGGAATIASLTFTFADGRLVSATQQRLTKPLPYSVVRVADPRQLSVSQTGTVVAVVTGTSTYQVLSVTRDGLMTQITARGVLAKQALPPPLTIAQLQAMSNAIDAALAQGK
jgi:hypothetical protein